MNDKRNPSPFRPNFEILRKIRGSPSDGIDFLVDIVGLSRHLDFREQYLSDVDWRGSDISKYDLTGADFHCEEATKEVLAHPMVKAVLEHFPNAKVTAVRPKQTDREWIPF